MNPSSFSERVTATAGLGHVGQARQMSSDTSLARRSGDLSAALGHGGDADVGRTRQALRHGGPPDPVETRHGLQVRKHHGIWQVRVDGVFHGDYHQEAPARAAAALRKLSPP